jgi:hemolysin activation/secretion protein
MAGSWAKPENSAAGLRTGRIASVGARVGLGLLVAAALPLLGLPSAALAQVAPPPPPPPPSSQIGAGSLPSHEELQAGAPPAPAPRPARSRLHVDDTIEHAPCALDNPSYADVRVHISDVSFDHLGPVPASVLADTWKPYAGTDQPISVVCRIRDAAATALRAMGYLAAVEVPVQRIVDGQVHFEVLYAKVVSVRVIGHPGRDAGLLQGYLNGLVDGKVFNRFKAERYVLLARDIPGYELYLSLKPSGTGAGNLIAEVRVETTPIEIDATASDLAAPATGRVGGQLRATFNGLTGLGDQTTISAYSTIQFHKQQIWQIGHQFQLGASGFQLSGHLTYAVTRPALGSGIPPIDARTWLADFALSYPLLRGPDASLRASAGLDILDQNVLFGGGPLSRDRLRVGFVRLDGDVQDSKGRGPQGAPLWRLSGDVELRHGLAILGATPYCVTASQPCAPGFGPSVLIGDPQATVFRATADITLHPSADFTLEVSPRVQIASAPVYAFEQFTLGNYTVGRGYSPGVLSGDDGVSVSADLRGPVVRLSPHSHFTLQPYAFSDNGWVYRRLLDPKSPAFPGNPQDLHSLGAGARVTFENAAQVDFSVAAPLTRIFGETRVEPPLFLVTLSVSLVPWRYR